MGWYGSVKVYKALLMENRSLFYGREDSNVLDLPYRLEAS